MPTTTQNSNLISSILVKFAQLRLQFSDTFCLFSRRVLPIHFLVYAAILDYKGFPLSCFDRPVKTEILAPLTLNCFPNFSIIFPLSRQKPEKYHNAGLLDDSKTQRNH